MWRYSDISRFLVVQIYVFFMYRFMNVLIIQTISYLAVCRYSDTFLYRCIRSYSTFYYWGMHTLKRSEHLHGVYAGALTFSTYVQVF